MTYSFFITNYLLLLWLLYYQNLKRFHRVVFLEEGAMYHFWHIFYRFLSRIFWPSLCKNEIDDIFFFHHELSSSAMLSLLSKFKKISPCSFLRRGRYIPLLAYFLLIFLTNIEAFIVQKTKSMTYSFFIMNYLLLLWLLYYQNFKRFYRVVFLGEDAIYHFWHILYRIFSQIVRPSLCKNEIDDIFFFHHELSSSAMLSLLSQFQKISPCRFLRRGAIYHFGHIFYRFLSRIFRPSLCKNEIDDIFFFHHELSSSAMVTLLSKFKKISPCSFLRRGRYVPLLAYFL